MKIYLGSLIKVYDIETLRNCFIYMDIDAKTDISDLNNISESQINIFVIHYSRNDLTVFIRYLKTLKGQIGFNNLSFDSQVCQFIINNEELWESYHSDQITEEIFKFAQEQINKQGVGFPTFNERNLYCKQCDLYKIHHFDNMAKVQSLKGLQCNLNSRKVQEMPIDYKESINKDQLQLIIDYCKNDIVSTFQFYKHDDTKKAIDLRKGLIKSYNLDHIAMNWSDTKIGSELILKFYCEYTKKNPKEVRKMRTERTTIDLKDCIPPQFKFRSKEFSKLLELFNSTTLYSHNDFKFGPPVEDTKKKKKKKKDKVTVNYKGLSYEYGTGGIHASDIGVFESYGDYLLYDIDVASLYPSIAIANNYYPEHLGTVFMNIYRDKIVDVRLKEKAKGKKLANKAIVLGLKNAANSVYGNSNCAFSFLFDPKYTFSTTVTGQIILSILAENISEDIPNSRIVYCNTDGITVLLHKDTVVKFQEICSNWEKLTGLLLEGYIKRENDNEVIYKKLYLRDTNNYLAIPFEGDIKFKGCFEKNKLLHKDPSARIVPLALENYIVHGKSVEDTINTHDIIWDFLKRQKFKSDSYGAYYSSKNGKLNIEKAQKVARYFVAGSKTGKIFIKHYPKSGKKSALEKGFLCCEAQIIEDENAFNYDINRKYYILETYKIINAVEKRKNQLSLF